MSITPYHRSQKKEEDAFALYHTYAPGERKQLSSQQGTAHALYASVIEGQASAKDLASFQVRVSIAPPPRVGALRQEPRAYIPTQNSGPSISRPSSAIALRRSEDPPVQGSPWQGVKSWTEAAPSLEEIAEKIRCLQPLIQRGAGVACCTTAAAICIASILKGLPMLCPAPIQGGIALLTVTASGITGALSIILPSVQQEMSLKRTAALSEGEETVVYIMPKSTGDALTHHPKSHEHEVVQKLAEGRKLVVARVDSTDEIATLLRSHQNISHIWITGHGTPVNIRLSKNEPWTAAQLSHAIPAECLTPEAQIILDSCSTGISPLQFSLRKEAELETRGIINHSFSTGCISRPSFAEELRDALPKVAVVASTHDISNGKKCIDGEVRFFSYPEGKDCTVTFKQTQEGDSTS